MNFELPEVNWQDKNWTIPGQIKKIFEEAGEVAEAIAMNDPVNTIREALDTMQTCATLISMVQAEYKAPLGKFLLEHESKLIRKGYIAKFKGTTNKGLAYLTEKTLEQKILLIDELAALRVENNQQRDSIQKLSEQVVGLQKQLNIINNLTVKFQEDGPFTHQEAFDRVAEIYNLSFLKEGD